MGRAKKAKNKKQASKFWRRTKTTRTKLQKLQPFLEKLKSASKKLNTATAEAQHLTKKKAHTACDTTYITTKAKCMEVAETQVRQSSIVASLTLDQGAGDLSSTNSEFHDKITKISKECTAKAKALMKKCKQAMEKQTENEKALQGYRSKLQQQAHKSRAAKLLGGKVADLNQKMEKMLAPKPLAKSVPVGIFVADSSVWYVNKHNKKQLIKFPTKGCGRATEGISPEFFDDEPKKELYFMDKKASEQACDGPVYSNVDEPAVWAHCDCNGVENKEQEGTRCAVWTQNEQPWCYVSASCLHPHAQADTGAPDDAKRLHGCFP